MCLSVLKLAPVEYATNAFSSKEKYAKLAVVVHVLKTTQKLVISRCCFAKDGREMYQKLQYTCAAIVLLIKPFPFAIVVIFCVRSLFPEECVENNTKVCGGGYTPGSLP